MSTKQARHSEKSHPMRRALTGVAAAVLGAYIAQAPVAAAGSGPIVIGLTSDASGQYANSGASDRRGMLMAIAEFNAKGGVLGRKIETIHIDTETTPATGSRVAERMISRDKVSFMIGAVSSGVANAISHVAQQTGVIYLHTPPSPPTEPGNTCHRAHFVSVVHASNSAPANVLRSDQLFVPEYTSSSSSPESSRYAPRDPRPSAISRRNSSAFAAHRVGTACLILASTISRALGSSSM